MDQDGTWYGGWPWSRPHCARWGPNSPPQNGRGVSLPNFRPISIVAKGWTHQDTTWYGGRPQPRRLCVRWGPSALPRKGAKSPIFGPCLLWLTPVLIRIPLGMKVGLSLGNIVIDGDSALPFPKVAQPPIFSQCPLWPNGWMDEDASWYGGRPQPRQLCVRWGPSSPRKKGHSPPTQFLANIYCGQTAGWIKMPLDTEVNLGPADVVLGGVAAPPS